MEQLKSKILSGILGIAIGDALGIPVKYTCRSDFQQSPLSTMTGNGLYDQPPGTWSECSSIPFCITEALTQGQWSSSLLLRNIAIAMIQWHNGQLWTPRGTAFEVGGIPPEILDRLQQGTPPAQCGEPSDRSSNSGMLTRVLPLAFCEPYLDFKDLIKRVHKVAAMINRHPRSQMACSFYVATAIALLNGQSPRNAYLESVQRVGELYEHSSYSEHLDNFLRLLRGNIIDLPESKIHSNGRSVETLEAALWCLYNSSSYEEAVLKAVNLGDDTNTTAGVTGGLAGLYYGAKDMSVDWIQKIARFYDILNLATRYAKTLESLDERVEVQV
ncbi:ADP-ribosylglycohydrolase family protein [Spirulina sp. CS-785/01]|uniref:ADP-ribosylglycohydrolase family protein n=1 Tax=Spirulina sp. CS-785/01 TaxID=3021716 RepID=UPI00232EB115|nr:ADP-ribosylglycohydrolase family protein [Spirulina sp. CS-785/01]MDB9311702.1 ADP-ribosylglycohydrolase family protein [Spirulina sp. CS-785/01]